MAAVLPSLTGSAGQASVRVWLLLAVGSIIAGVGLGTSAETKFLSREETLAGIQALWDLHVQELPRSAARQIGAIYARYSTKGQSSVLDQVRTCLEFATKEGIHVPLECIFFDLGVSGRKSRRAGYEALEACLAKNQVQALLVFTTNRLHRRANRALDFVEMLVKERRMRVVFVMNHIDSQNDSHWKRFVMFLALHDEFAAEMYVENIRASHIGKLLGRLVHGTITFGYHGVEIAGAVSRKGKPQRTIEIDPVEAAIVRRVFDAFVVQCLSIKRIIQQLNSDPSLPRPRKGGRQWTRLAVLTLLKNERYRGRWSYGDKESVLLPSKDYIRQIGREEPLKTVQFEELRIISDEPFFRAQRRLADLRPEGGRTPREENVGRLPLILNGLFWCPMHEHYLTVGGSKGHYLVCPACERETIDRKHLVSHLNRVTALKQLCTVLGEAIGNDEGLIEQIVGHCRRAAEERQVPDPIRREALKERKKRLTRSLRVLTHEEPASDTEEQELKAALREKRSDLAKVETELAQIDNAASTVIRIPTPEEVQTQLRTLADQLLHVAAEGAPAEIDALKELLKRLTGGKIELHQCGERKPHRGWLEGRFQAPLVQIISEAVSGATLSSSESGSEIRVAFRREATDTEQMRQAWELYQQGHMQKEIAAELGCSKSNVTRLLKKAADLNGVAFQDGRKRRGTLPRKQEQTPAYVELGDRAVEMWNLGKSYREIGRECGCSDTTAEKTIRHWHVNRGLPVPTPETRREEQCAVAERMHGEGLSWDEIARQLNVSTATLRSWRERPAA